MTLNFQLDQLQRKVYDAYKLLLNANEEITIASSILDLMILFYDFSEYLRPHDNDLQFLATSVKFQDLLIDHLIGRIKATP
jgi:hypothetical protein